MNRYLLLLLQFLCIGPLLAQKWDNNWPGGINEFPGSPGSGNYLIHFEAGFPQVVTVDLKMNFESTVASLSDSTGKLILYTNGCRISGSNGESLINGDGLNPGEVRDSVCPKNGYIAPRGAMFIPMPGAETAKTILLHMGVHYDADNRVLYGPFYCSVVDLATGSVIEKNHELLSIIPGTQSFEPFSVVRHGNGRDWWVVVPEFGTNRYHLFLLGKAGIPEMLAVQQIGPPLGGHRPGSSIFSPDGQKFARSHNHGTVVMDFDRCTGLFQNPILLNRPTDQFGGGGLAFSPNGGQLLASAQRVILSANLAQAQPKLDTLLGVAAIAPYSLGYCQMGPDSNLYFASMQRLKRMPFLKNAFDLPQPADYSAIPLPVWGVRSVPYFPNFRLRNFVLSPCDTLDLIISVDQGPLVDPLEKLVVRPNPASDFVKVELPVCGHYKLLVFNILGQLINRFEEINDNSAVWFDTNLWPAGTYIVMLYPEGERPLSARFSVVH